MAKVMGSSEARDVAIMEEMRRDPTIWVNFEYGYFFGGTRKQDALTEFGLMDRICPGGITETQTAGAGVGAALAGTRPIIQLMMSDFAVDCWGQIVLQAAKIRFKIAYKLDCPVIFRMGVAGGIRGTVHHSGYYGNWLANAPGLIVAIPSSPADVRGFWRTALRTNKDPVCMLENSMPEGPVPDGDYTIPFGVADVKREGSDVTIAAVGYWVNSALEAAEDLASQGIDAEVWDPRTLKPLDRDSLIKSVKKTGALVAIDQAPKTFGGAGEFMATVAEAITPVPPMSRLATMDSPIPASTYLTAGMYPTKDKIIKAVKDVLKRKG